jgi:hypothetical protein
MSVALRHSSNRSTTSVAKVSLASDVLEVMEIVSTDVRALGQYCSSQLKILSALAFAYVERLLRARDAEIAVVTALSTLDTTLPMLESAGFQKLVYEDFYEALVELIRGVITPSANGKTMTERMLLDAFQSAEGARKSFVQVRRVVFDHDGSFELDRGISTASHFCPAASR